jgi:hypothetical protein
MHGSIRRVVQQKQKSYRPCIKAIAKMFLFSVATLLPTIAAILLVTRWYQNASLLTPKDRITTELDVLKTLAQLLGGVVLLIGIYFTWKNISATNKNLEIAQDGQVFERFNKAIEHIGKENIQARVGGIYALEAVARHAKTQADYWMTVEILVAFVRERAKWSAEKPSTKPERDIQAALNVLGRRRFTWMEQTR